MPSLTVEVSEDVLSSLNETPEAFSKSMRLLAAAKLVELGRLSTGRAADLAGMCRVEFLDALRDMKVPPGPMDEASLESDFRNA